MYDANVPSYIMRSPVAIVVAVGVAVRVGIGVFVLVGSGVLVEAGIVVEVGTIMVGVRVGISCSHPSPMCA
jgi:hypothetical protein